MSHRLKPYFSSQGLPIHLAAAADPFAALAKTLFEADVMDEDQRTQAIQHLLQARDCFLHCVLQIKKE